MSQRAGAFAAVLPGMSAPRNRESSLIDDSAVHTMWYGSRWNWIMM